MSTSSSRFGAQQWLILVAAVVSVAITASLGAWQLRRAAFKEQLAEQISQRNQLPALKNTALNASNFVATPQDEGAWLQRRASVQGRWLHEHTVFLDNRPMQVAGSQRVGFHVATPLAIEGGQRVIWVQRGWVQRDFQDRSKVPELTKSDAVVTVQGRLTQRISRAYEMQGVASAPASTSAGPSRIWQNLPSVSFGSKELLPMALLQTSPDTEKDGLLRDWPAPDTGVAKHHGYAFQWFALSALLVILYVWFQIISPRRKR
ncbi:SURF1 family protein [Variovorax sp. PCZ-1]|nr:SURF1 family protein [Variovorax sp. PCZ-1]MBS7808318.1 SURF1 family protein [Variovorax sp. PCZ-1]